LVNNITFGQHLRLLREKVNLTQEELASFLHITHQSISKWENDQSLPSIDYCLPLAKVFKCSLDDLFKYLNPYDDEW
jgi:DNA-binding XRE family transcriptional regulator